MQVQQAGRVDENLAGAAAAKAGATAKGLVAGAGSRR